MRLIKNKLVIVVFAALLLAAGCATIEEEYTGEKLEGLPHGHGTIKYPNGTTYEGEFIAGSREGIGDWIHKSGISYSGLWQNNTYHGEGVLVIPGNLTYSGKWSAGFREGLGTQVWEDGSRYEGVWQNDLRHGHGTMHYTDGSHYEGSWQAGKRSGEGVLVTAENDVIAGMWLNDQFQPVAVERVSLSSSAITIIMGSPGTSLEAIIYPADATDQTITWSSDNPAVAGVQNGLVYPVSTGTAVITVTASEITADAAVQVRPAPVRVSGIDVDRKIIQFFVEDRPAQLTASVTPANAANKTVVWSSSNENVAKVNDSGVITPVAMGESYITATTADGGYSATCFVTVSYPSDE